MNEATSLIHNIRLTEKATLLGEKHNQYVFRVDPRANKLQIKQAIQKLFRRKWFELTLPNTPGKRSGNVELTLADAHTGRRRS